MKVIRITAALLCIILTAALCSCGQKSESKDESKRADGEYRLVFADEFEQNKLDRSVWGNEIGFLRNNEPQYYTDREKNAYIEDGSLVIACMAEDYTADDGTPAKYTSASINTRETKSFTYGKFEIRAKLPVTDCAAAWPAFWMMGVTVTTIGWPKCGEVDVLEMYGTNIAKYYANVHWFDDAVGDYTNIFKHDNEIKKVNNRPLGDDWHIYGVEWTAEQFRFYFDDETIGTVEIGENMDELQKPHYLLLNMAMTQEGDTAPVDNGEVLKYKIDYVRVYQKD